MSIDADQYLLDVERFTDSLIYALTSMSNTTNTTDLRGMAYAQVLRRLADAIQPERLNGLP